MCHDKLRYFDWDGQVHLVKGKTGGQQGDPLEMLIFNLTIHHLWGRVFAKYPETRLVNFTDDGYITGKLSVTLQVLTEQKRVLKEDVDLELNVLKTSCMFDVVHKIINASPTLSYLSRDVLLVSFCPEGFVGIGVPIGSCVLYRVL